MTRLHTTRSALVALALSLMLAGGRLRAEDCNANGIDDATDIAMATSRDCNANTIPDECDFSDERTQFEIARRYDAGGNAVGIVGMDFDNDGDTDIALTASLTKHPGEGPFDGIVLLENRGGFRFEPQAPIVTETPGVDRERRPHHLLAVDLDGDGDDDIVSQQRLSSEIVWSLSNGDGTFSPPSFLELGGAHISRLSAGDLDGDGDVDAVAAGYGRDTLAVIENDGAGNLSSAGTIPTAGATFALVRDLDADGDDDLVVVNRGSEEEPQGFLRVYTSNGDMTFGGPQSYGLGGLPGYYDGTATAADLDGDSILDLVASNTGSDSVSVLLGNGDGTFREPIEYATGMAPDLLAIGDLDRDGDIDLVTTGKSRSRGPEDLSVLLNNGDGTFAAPAVHRLGDNQQPVNLLIADTNGDGHLDVVVENYWGGSVAVFQNGGYGQLEPAGVHAVSRGAARGLLVSDLDLDGDLDVATASIIRDDSLSILENVTGAGFNRGCGEFLRGDVNMDGEVSVADLVMFRRYFFDATFAPSCQDAADVNDNDMLGVCDEFVLLHTLYRSPDWTELLPMPSPEPGIDPTGFSGAVGEAFHTEYGGCSSNSEAKLPLGCAETEIVPPERSSDAITIGDVDAAPGETVLVPVLLTNDVPVDAVQLVLSYDPELLEFDPRGIVFENTYYARFEGTGPVAVLGVHPEAGVITVVVGSLVPPTRVIEPGVDQVIAWLTVTVSAQAGSGGVIQLAPTNGPGGEGVGPFKLRNETVAQSGARFLSLLPDTEPGFLNIVGDQAFFTRGDSNGDGTLNVSDPIHTLGALFLGAQPLECEDAADANDDGAVDVSDVSATLDFLFRESIGSLPAPHAKPGPDPTEDGLRCSRS